jgi:16S rRNA (cytosine967-C5)-methyltransferase
MIAPARALAFDVLLDTHRGGYASDLLFFRSAGLDARDAALAHELVLGCLRYQLQLDHVIEVVADRTQKLPIEVRIALRLGIYQLRHLTRIPGHAAVNQSVDLVKRARRNSAAGFVNAILRRVGNDPIQWPRRELRLSAPEWLISRWEAQFGTEIAEGIARAALSPPETWVRFAGAPPPELEATELAGCYRVRSGPPPSGARIQDIGSQSIVPLLNLSPGQTFLDLCAGPGNKTAQALETAMEAVACDVNWKRLSKIRGCQRVALDATRPLPIKAEFDRILVDAPCSGTGTLSRNPEIKLRLQPSDIAQLTALQRAILMNALNYLAPSGRLVYSTCSLEKEENQEVVEAVLMERAGTTLVETSRRLPGVHPGDGFFAAVIALS